ncbi:hypothetical protein V6N11_019218 [Hibiscus sabdariffa]|uniref:Uncharacterized protein n=2 Tax=Hibiscus sabdariffa TaxID=183260 RepID=A0ABR2R1Q5_9ROSI
MLSPTADDGDTSLLAACCIGGSESGRETCEEAIVFGPFTSFEGPFTGHRYDPVTAEVNSQLVFAKI